MSAPSSATVWDSFGVPKEGKDDAIIGGLQEDISEQKKTQPSSPGLHFHQEHFSRSRQKSRRLSACKCLEAVNVQS